MKKLSIAVALLLAGFYAKADTITAEFAPCKQNLDQLCAWIQGQELYVEADALTSQAINQRVGPQGRTFAMNVQGHIYRVNRLSGSSYRVLHVDNLSTEDGEQPRGF